MYRTWNNGTLSTKYSYPTIFEFNQFYILNSIFLFVLCSSHFLKHTVYVCKCTKCEKPFFFVLPIAHCVHEPHLRAVLACAEGIKKKTIQMEMCFKFRFVNTPTPVPVLSKWKFAILSSGAGRRPLSSDFPPTVSRKRTQRVPSTVHRRSHCHFFAAAEECTIAFLLLLLSCIFRARDKELVGCLLFSASMHRISLRYETVAPIISMYAGDHGGRNLSSSAAQPLERRKKNKFATRESFGFASNTDLPWHSTADLVGGRNGAARGKCVKQMCIWLARARGGCNG